MEHGIIFVVTWTSVEGAYIFYEDGKVVGNGILTRNDGESSAGKVINGGGLWVLGYDQDTVGGGFTTDQALKGEILQVNIWNRVLTPRNIDRLSKSCLRKQRGNVMSWKEFEDGVKGNVQTVKAAC